MVAVIASGGDGDVGGNFNSTILIRVFFYSTVSGAVWKKACAVFFIIRINSLNTGGSLHLTTGRRFSSHPT
jgi:hypothetical protein